MPTSPTPAFKLGERVSDPLQMYLADVFTVSANGRYSVMSVQAGGQAGNLSGYISADVVNDNGWRQFYSSSQLRRIYADLGARGDRLDVA